MCLYLGNSPLWVFLVHRWLYSTLSFMEPGSFHLVALPHLQALWLPSFTWVRRKEKMENVHLFFLSPKVIHISFAYILLVRINYIYMRRAGKCRMYLGSHFPMTVPHIVKGNLDFCLCHGDAFFFFPNTWIILLYSPLAFKIFFLFFCSLNRIFLGVVFWYFPACYSLSFLDLWFAVSHWFGEIHYYYLKYFFHSFLYSSSGVFVMCMLYLL